MCDPEKYNVKIAQLENIMYNNFGAEQEKHCLFSWQKREITKYNLSRQNITHLYFSLIIPGAEIQRDG
jgi:hypothetical protein